MKNYGLRRLNLSVFLYKILHQRKATDIKFIFSANMALEVQTLKKHNFK